MLVVLLLLCMLRIILCLLRLGDEKTLSMSTVLGCVSCHVVNVFVVSLDPIFLVCVHV